MISRPRRFFALALGLALLLAAAERAAVAVRSRMDEAARGASWIWAAGVAHEARPIAFYAVRDFEIDRLTGRTARLVITGDESYVAFVNGRRVGSGAFRPEAPADLYDVTAELEAGWNRLVVELASSRGAGGLLASLRLDDRPIVSTDAGWRVFRRLETGLLRGWPLRDGEAAEVWQRHPTGRWELASPAPRPVLPVEFPSPTLRRAVRLRPSWSSRRSVDLSGGKLPAARSPWTVFDWGTEVTGYLTLELAADDAAPGLLHVGLEAPDREAAADALIVPVPGQRFWVDPHLRSFRYAVVGGVELRSVPEVWRIEPSIARQLATPERLTRGVFGITPPHRESAAVEAVRARLRQAE